MKLLLVTWTFLFSIPSAFGQTADDGMFFRTNTKTDLYYVEVNGTEARVFEMGRHMDVGGSRYSIRSKDILRKQPDGNNTSYAGRFSKLVNENGKHYLLIQKRKTARFSVEPVDDKQSVTTILNNAYFLDSYSAMARELNSVLLTGTYSFRYGFSSWKALNNQHINHSDFVAFTDKALSEIKDRMIAQDKRLVSLRASVLRDIETISYPSLKDSLTILSPDRMSMIPDVVIIELISAHRPELFFRLSEDFPEQKDLIFAAVKNKKRLMEKLRAVPGHEEVKKEFFSTKKYEKAIPYHVIGAYALVIVGGVLLAAQ